MSDKFFNLIIHADIDLNLKDEGKIEMDRKKFLKYTYNSFENKSESLDNNLLKELKSFLTIFATPKIEVDPRIGIITNIEVFKNTLKIKYRFIEDFYPLSKYSFGKFSNKLGITKFHTENENLESFWAVRQRNLYALYEKYSKSMACIANRLKTADKKAQLIYAFNGTGKTLLSRYLIMMIDPENIITDEEGRGFDIRFFDKNEKSEFLNQKVLCYGDLIEELFYWDRIVSDKYPRPVLQIKKNNFIDWLVDAKDCKEKITENFQRYTNTKLMPIFSAPKGSKDDQNIYQQVSFTYKNKIKLKIKISRGEESIFIWSVFYTCLNYIIDTLKKQTEEVKIKEFKNLEYVLIDDPVSSLDDNHLIALAVDVAELIKKAPENLKFFITTHNTLFYNVLYNELNNKQGYLLKHDVDVDGDKKFTLTEKQGAANISFSYHLHLKQILEDAVKNNKIEKYHFMFLRNLYEKTSSFLGYKKWSQLLPNDKNNKNYENYKNYLKRIINSNSHSVLADEAFAAIDKDDRDIVKFLLEHLIDNYSFAKK